MRADQLPRPTVKLDKLPGQYLSSPRVEVRALADLLERNMREDLARLGIRDAATLRGCHGTLLVLAQFKGDWVAVPGLVDTLRALQ